MFGCRYEHPGYGVIEVVDIGDELRFDYYTVGGVLGYVHYDTYEFTPEREE